MNDARIAFEASALAPYFPEFRWYSWDGGLFTEGPLRTNSGTGYAVRVLLGPSFPEEIPTALITHPRPLLDCFGNPMTQWAASAKMHTLSPQDDLPVICHYPSWTWGPHRTVYQVVVKARLWLEAYEQHLRHYRPIDTWLGHAPTGLSEGTP